VLAPDVVLNYFTEVSAILLEFSLLVLAFWKRIFEKLFCLFCYVLILVVWDTFGFSIQNTPLFSSPKGILIFYVFQFTLYFVRLFIFYEITWRVLRDYVGVWHYAGRFLAALSAVFFVWMGISLWQHWGHYRRIVITASAQISVTEAVLWLFFLAIGIYYEVPVSRFFKFVLVPSCIYSAVDVTSYTYAFLVQHPTNSAFDYFERFTFLFMAVTWAWGIWRWSDVPAPAPAIFSQEIYDDVSPQIHSRLRLLNDRLSDLLRKHKKK
jgi:hypothetical protein